MRYIIKSSLLLSVLLTPLLSYGDQVAPPTSFTIVSPNGKFLFVMIAPDKTERDGVSSGGERSRETDRIRAKYPSSGMYLNNGSITPLWTVAWYADVLVASDGVHVVRRGPWPMSLSDEAVTFFANGKELRSYKISDLVSDESLLPRSTSHFEWVGNMKLDDEKRTLSVATLSQETFVFDYTTGEIISANRLNRPTKAEKSSGTEGGGISANRLITAIVVTSILVLLIFIAFSIIKRKRQVTKGAV